MSVNDMLAAYRTGSLDPVTALEDCLGQISAAEPGLNAIASLAADSAREAARASRRRWRSGDVRRLEGVPFLVKDIIDCVGLPSAGGSSIYRDRRPDTTAACVTRLLSAGAVLVGKTNTFEFAYGSEDNEFFGVVRNPWDTGRTTGGSSSGSAAAVAAGYVPFALGTDTGGSIREPSSYCGLTSIKPTFGLVPRHGVMPLAWSLDHVGIMARDATDLAATLPVMAGFDDRDPTSARRPLDEVRRTDDLVGVTVGVPRNWFWEIVDEDTRAAGEQVAEHLRELGATVEQVEVADVELCPAIGWTILSAEFGSAHEDNHALWSQYTAGNRDALPGSMFISASDYLRAQRLRTKVMQGFERAFDSVDVILTPGSIKTASRLGATEAVINGSAQSFTAMLRTMWPANVTGLPAVSLPSGHDTQGMPLGVQLLGRPFSDLRVVETAAAYQRATSHHRERAQTS